MRDERSSLEEYEWQQAPSLAGLLLGFRRDIPIRSQTSVMVSRDGRTRAELVTVGTENAYPLGEDVTALVVLTVIVELGVRAVVSLVFLDALGIGEHTWGQFSVAAPSDAYSPWPEEDDVAEGIAMTELVRLSAAAEVDLCLILETALDGRPE